MVIVLFQIPGFDISPELQQGSESSIEDSAPKWFQEISTSSEQDLGKNYITHVRMG